MRVNTTRTNFKGSSNVYRLPLDIQLRVFQILEDILIKGAGNRGGKSKYFISSTYLEKGHLKQVLEGISDVMLTDLFTFDTTEERHHVWWNVSNGNFHNFYAYWEQKGGLKL